MTHLRPNMLLLAALAIFCFAPHQALAKTSEVAPPAADETLIYVIRESRLLGKANGYWIALNDQTVARIRNKKHAIIRAKAGILTLSLANSGYIFAAAAIDNRPGETVYLKWRLGDTELTEIDESAASKLLKKSKLMDPIDAPKPNNEEMAVLMNLSRLGFDLMQPATGQLEPDAEHAIITFFRRGEADKIDFGISGEQGYVGTLAADEAVSIAVPAGTHHFMASNLGTSLLKAQVEAGKRYYVWYDYGKMMGRVRLTPVTREQSKDLQGWLEKVSYVQRDPSAASEGVRKREEIAGAYIRSAAARTETGQADFHLLGSEHAF